MAPRIPSYGDPLDEVAGDAPLAPVVDLGGAGLGVPGQVVDRAPWPPRWFLSYARRYPDSNH